MGLGLSLNGSGANISDNFSDQLSTSEKLALQKLTDNGLMTQLQASWQDATQLTKQDGEKLSTQNQFVGEHGTTGAKCLHRKAAANESYEEAKTLASMDKMSSDDMRIYLHKPLKIKKYKIVLLIK
ncbi:hypothetical protein [Photobacterium leiognathi]|uniref:hypothetical protein n=1 Tax=Photobacterium leiognathi TaxID=553611 RepID=UPI0027388FC9|nr:hypothetical protein [Photobacterium leiognathi]